MEKVVISIYVKTALDAWKDVAGVLKSLKHLLNKENVKDAEQTKKRVKL